MTEEKALTRNRSIGYVRRLATAVDDTALQAGWLGSRVEPQTQPIFATVFVHPNISKDN
jgi:hypothetical protein